jgi:menaquinone-dependent protoporphyrinogen oxidase
MKVLVVFGSKRGGTAELASMIGTALDAAGVEAVVRSAQVRPDLGDYDGVVVVGALDVGRWDKDARRFVKRHAESLSTMPVWLASSGPLDDSAATKEIPPVRQVSKLMQLVNARGHATFGGALSADAKGFPARAMAKGHSGDWHDTAHVQRWTANVASELAAVARARLG